MKRFAVTGITRDKEYNLTPGQPGSRVVWFSANPNGEAEVVKVVLRPKARLVKLQIDIDFAQLAIKGKQSLGNLVTRNEVARFSLKERGVSTLGGLDVWFDRDVLRLNYDRRGESLGIFQGDDKVLIIQTNGEYFTSSYADTNHYEDNILRIEKFQPDKVWTLALYDATLGAPYLKRFTFEATAKPQRFVGTEESSRILLLTDTADPDLVVEYNDADRPDTPVNAAEFIAVKSFKAKGKRLTLAPDVTVREIPKPEPEEQPQPDEPQEPENREEPEEPGQSGQPETPMVSEPSLFDFDD